MEFFELCELLPIVTGTLLLPNADVQPDNAKSWLFNDRFPKVLIRKSVGADQFINITHRDTYNSMWKSLISVHEARGHQTAMAIHRALTQTHAEEVDDIITHVHRLKEYLERFNTFNAPAFTVP